MLAETSRRTIVFEYSCYGRTPATNRKHQALRHERHSSSLIPLEDKSFDCSRILLPAQEHPVSIQPGPWKSAGAKRQQQRQRRRRMDWSNEVSLRSNEPQSRQRRGIHTPSSEFPTADSEPTRRDCVNRGPDNQSAK